MNNSKKVNEKCSKKDYQKSSKKVYSRSDKAITLIALIVTIIVLLILAGVTINLAVNNQGIFNKAKTATGAYKNASENEQTGLNEADKEIAKYMPKEGSEGGSGSESGGETSGSGSITYTDSAGKTQILTKDTPTSDYGTKVGNTTITNSDNEEIKLDWYLFDVSDDGKTAYLVSTPTYWVPDKTKEVRGAWVPKLVSQYVHNTGATYQAIRKKTDWTDNYSASNMSEVTYSPSVETQNYFKSVNKEWAKSENASMTNSTQEFSEWSNGRAKEACYLADAEIFAEIKNQVNNADGNLKGKINTLVGGASIEQWCKAYNKQTIVQEKQPKGGITCEYSDFSRPGYKYIVNGVEAGWRTDSDVIVGNDIYGAAHKNNHTDNSTYPFSKDYQWLLASPDSTGGVCGVVGKSSMLEYDAYGCYNSMLSLFASVSL